jgi:nitrile hydratase accessory protein
MKVLGKDPVFALAVHLSESGLFTWSVWAERFSQTLSAHGIDRELDGGDDYFTAWLATLESLLAERDIAAPSEVSRAALGLGGGLSKHPSRGSGTLEGIGT